MSDGDAGRGGRERRDLRLAQDPEQHDVRGRHPQRVLDHVGNASRVRDVGEPHDQRAPLLRGHHRRRGGGMVGFDAVGVHERERLDQTAQMHGAARGRDALLQPAPVREQPHAVAGGERHLRERQRRRDGRVEHRLRADARAKEAAGIDEQPHGLAALGLIDLRDQLSAPRRRAPAHVAPLVAGTVVAQAVELPAGANPLRAPLLDRHLSAANQVQRLPPPLLQIRIDPDGLLDGRNAPPLDEAPRVAPLQSHPSHRSVTALARRHVVFDPRRRAVPARSSPSRAGPDGGPH